MENLPVHIPATFILITAIGVWLLYKATCHSKLIVVLAILWLLVQGALAWFGFYVVTHTLPPRFLLVILPPFLVIMAVFFTAKGRHFTYRLDGRVLTLLHLIRVPVEIVLYWLYLNAAVPELMTFEGRNFDILAGLSAPVIYYFGYRRHKLPKSVLLGWNFICLGLLFNIIINGILSVPTPFQQFGLEQPNVALLYFPFTWLPGFIVPLVLFSHLVAIRQLMSNKAGSVSTQSSTPLYT